MRLPFFWTLPKRPRQTVVVVSGGQDGSFQSLYLQKWLKSAFAVVVMVEGVFQGLIVVHRKFTNAHPVFCQKNVRCMVRGRLGAAESKILPRCHNSLSAHSVPSESCWGVSSPNPALRSLTAAATSPSDRALQALSPRKVIKNSAKQA